jgi:uncharacterized protein YuzE
MIDCVYDHEADVLYLAIEKPIPAICEQPIEGVLVRIDPETKQVVGLTILDYGVCDEARWSEIFEIDLPAELHEYVVGLFDAGPYGKKEEKPKPPGCPCDYPNFGVAGACMCCAEMYPRELKLQKEIEELKAKITSMEQENFVVMEEGCKWRWAMYRLADRVGLPDTSTAEEIEKVIKVVLDGAAS